MISPIKAHTGHPLPGGSGPVWGMHTKDVTVRSHLDVAPAFMQLPVDTTVTDGMTATLRCEVSGAPKPAITWRRGG